MLHTGQEDIWEDGLGIFETVHRVATTNASTGYISSIKHGSSLELVHVRLLLDRYEVDDKPQLRRKPPGIPENALYYVEDADGTPMPRIKVFERRKVAMWQHFTDYNGMAVPLEVIERMRQVEGVTEDQWDRRGVEVGAQAWKVLTDWQASMKTGTGTREPS
jgi:hypothetical protein